jgi:hypothetical protein
MKTPKMAGLATLGVAFIASFFVMTLGSCSVTPSGPVSAGATHGALAGDAMCDWYYKKSTGWTYAFNNVENVYNADGTIAATYTGAPDTVRALGYSGIAPNGDSLYRFAITYRVTTAFAGRNELTMNYVISCNNGNGAWVDGSATPSGMLTMGKKPRPVSTDTILAGLVGRIRTMSDDFTNSSSYVWQTDTLWASAHNDSVFVWENTIPGTSKLMTSRCIFAKDFVNNTNSNGTGANVSWMYDLIFNTTAINVVNANTSVTTPMATFSSSAQLQFTTNDPSLGPKDKLPTTEYKWYTFGIGVTKIYDSWYVTTDGTHFTKQDFTRSLVSLTHN